MIPGLLPIIINGCKIKFGSGLGTRLTCICAVKRQGGEEDHQLIILEESWTEMLFSNIVSAMGKFTDVLQGGGVGEACTAKMSYTFKLIKSLSK